MLLVCGTEKVFVPVIQTFLLLVAEYETFVSNCLLNFLLEKMPSRLDSWASAER